MRLASLWKAIDHLTWLLAIALFVSLIAGLALSVLLGWSQWVATAAIFAPWAVWILVRGYMGFRDGYRLGKLMSKE